MSKNARQLIILACIVVGGGAALWYFEYGPRVGYWRIMRTLERFEAPCTVSAAGRAIERCPWLAQDVVARGHELACHSYRWERHAEMAEAYERAIIAKTVAALQQAMRATTRTHRVGVRGRPSDRRCWRGHRRSRRRCGNRRGC